MAFEALRHRVHRFDPAKQFYGLLFAVGGALVGSHWIGNSASESLLGPDQSQQDVAALKKCAQAFIDAGAKQLGPTPAPGEQTIAIQIDNLPKECFSSAIHSMLAGNSEGQNANEITGKLFVSENGSFVITSLTRSADDFSDPDTMLQRASTLEDNSFGLNDVIVYGSAVIGAAAGYVVGRGVYRVIDSPTRNNDQPIG